MYAFGNRALAASDEKRRGYLLPRVGMYVHWRGVRSCYSAGQDRRPAHFQWQVSFRRVTMCCFRVLWSHRLSDKADDGHRVQVVTTQHDGFNGTSVVLVLIVAWLPLEASSVEFMGRSFGTTCRWRLDRR